MRRQVRMVSYCPRHCTARPELSGVAALAPEDAAAAAGDDGNGLWNAQPFRPPPGVPVPRCVAGCARAQPLEARQSAEKPSRAACLLWHHTHMPAILELRMTTGPKYGPSLLGMVLTMCYV